MPFNDGSGEGLLQIGYGCYQVTSEEPIFDAIRFGYRNLDTAQCYLNEEFVGRQLKRAYSELGLKRSDFFISSKVWITEFGYEKCKAAVEFSLKQLDLEYIDLMFMHFPCNEGEAKDYPHHVEERHGAWKALEEFVESGKVKRLGISNFLTSHIEDIISIAKIRPAVNQFELHPMYVEKDTIETCRKYGILVQAYSPFAQWNEKLVTHPTLVRISKAHNIDVAKTILLWMVHPSNNFAVLPKSATAARIASNIQIGGLEGLLTEQDIQDINELSAENMPIEWKAHGYP